LLGVLIILNGWDDKNAIQPSRALGNTFINDFGVIGSGKQERTFGVIG